MQILNPLCRLVYAQHCPFSVTFLFRDTRTTVVATLLYLKRFKPDTESDTVRNRLIAVLHCLAQSVLCVVSLSLSSWSLSLSSPPERMHKCWGLKYVLNGKCKPNSLKSIEIMTPLLILDCHHSHDKAPNKAEKRADCFSCAD